MENQNLKDLKEIKDFTIENAVETVVELIATELEDLSSSVEQRSSEVEKRLTSVEDKLDDVLLQLRNLRIDRSVASTSSPSEAETSLTQFEAGDQVILRKPGRGQPKEATFLYYERVNGIKRAIVEFEDKTTTWRLPKNLYKKEY